MMAEHQRHQTVPVFCRIYLLRRLWSTDDTQSEPDNKGKEKAFYICQTKNKGGDCTRHSIPEEVLKKIVLKEIQIYTALFVDYEMIMEELQQMEVSYDQVISYDTQIAKLQEEYNKCYSIKVSLADD